MIVKFKGSDIHLKNEALQVGQKAPDFVLRDNGLAPKSLKDFPGRKIISVVPSIDTGVCDTQTRRFNQEIENIANAQILTVSVDLPFAQARWCGAAGLDKAITLSDYFDHNFGLAYGLFIEELHLLSRAVFVLNSDDEIVYVEYLAEVADHPNYEAALEALKSAK